MDAISKKIISGFKILKPGLSDYKIRFTEYQAYVSGENLLYGYMVSYYGPYRKTLEAKLTALLKAITLKVKAKKRKADKWLKQL